MNNDQATQNNPSGTRRQLRANISRHLQAGILVAAIAAGGVWFAATPEANGLPLDRQDQAADAAHQAQARSQQLAQSHEAIQETFVATIPLASGEQPGRESRHMTRAATHSEAGNASPDDNVTAYTEIPHRADERVVEGNFVTDGEAGSMQEQVNDLGAKVNAGWIDGSVSF